MTLNAGTLKNTNSGNLGSFLPNNTNIVLNGGGTFDYSPSTTAPLSILATTTVTGTGGLTKTGIGSVAIAGAMTYSGPTVISNGEIRIRTANDRLPTGTALTVTSPGHLNTNALSQTVASLAGNGNVYTAGATLTVSGSASTIFSGILGNGDPIATTTVPATGNGRLAYTGTGTLTLSGQNTMSGTFTLNNASGTVTVTSTGKLCGPVCDVVITAGTLNLNYTGTQVVENLTGGSVGTIALTSGLVLATDPVASGTLSSKVTGDGGLEVRNANATIRTLTLNSATSDYLGITTVTKGIISVGSAQALGSAAGKTVVTSAGELIFTGAAVNFTIAEPIDIAGTGADTNGSVIFTTSGATPNLSGPITLTGNATVAASGTSGIAFTNANAFTGTTQTLTLQGGAVSTGTGGLVSGIIALGTGGVTKNQGGNWTLSGANTYGGLTTIIAGTLTLGGDAPFNLPGTLGQSISEVQMGDLSVSNSTATSLLLNGAFTVSRPIRVNSGDATILVSGTATIGGTNNSGTATYEADITVGNASGITNKTVNLTAASGGSVLISGNIVPAAGYAATVSVQKVGSGLVTLTGTNIYTGPTTITTGTLSVGSGGGGSIISPVNVKAAGTLAGTGYIGDGTHQVVVTVESNGTLSPGNSVGTLTVQNKVTFESGAKYAVELKGGGGLNAADALAVDGTAPNLNFSQGTILKLLSDAGVGTAFDPTLNSTYTIATLLSPGTITVDTLTAPTTLGFLVFDSNNPTATGTGPLPIDVAGLIGTGLFNGNRFTVTQDGTTVTLAFVVPEPGFLLGFAGLALLAFRRKA
ncbi:hypothetical protein BH11PLA2_BH11PLA2_02570 [soil metagenome]